MQNIIRKLSIFHVLHCKVIVVAVAQFRIIFLARFQIYMKIEDERLEREKLHFIQH